MKDPQTTCKWNADVKGQLCQCADCHNADGTTCEECSETCDLKQPSRSCQMYETANCKGGQR